MEAEVLLDEEDAEEGTSLLSDFRKNFRSPRERYDGDSQDPKDGEE